jgi:hypothetical protein
MSRIESVKPAGCSKRPSSAAAASEVANHTRGTRCSSLCNGSKTLSLFASDPLHQERKAMGVPTKLADFFNILLAVARRSLLRQASDPPLFLNCLVSEFASVLVFLQESKAGDQNHRLFPLILGLQTTRRGTCLGTPVSDKVLRQQSWSGVPAWTSSDRGCRPVRFRR